MRLVLHHMKIDFIHTAINTRLAYIHEGITTINKAQETHYYPFGMLERSENPARAGRSPLSNQPVNLGTERNNAYLYNGKLERSGNPACAGEFNDDMGLNWYACPALCGDYGARFYNPQIARWPCVNPLAEKYPFELPFAYTVNNVVI